MRKECQHCHELKTLTHEVRSDILRQRVCYPCAREAIRVNGVGGQLGNMTVVRLEPKSPLDTLLRLR